MTPQITTRTIVTQKDCAASSLCRPRLPPIGTAPALSAMRLGWLRLVGCAVIAGSRGLDRAGDEAGHFLGRAVPDRLVGDFVAAAQHGDAIGDGEHVGHAVADQEEDRKSVV